jgi:plasmid stabilization system protein ParE
VKPVRLVPAARRELAAAIRWYENQTPGLGEELLGAVDRTLSRVAESPARHPLWRADRPYRRIRVNGFRYLVIYEERGDVVWIYAVAHTSRKPGYWVRRARSAQSG